MIVRSTGALGRFAVSMVLLSGVLAACGTSGGSTPSASGTQASSSAPPSSAPAVSASPASGPSPSASAASVSAPVPAASSTTGQKPASGTPVNLQVVVEQTGGAAFIGGAEVQALQAMEKMVNQEGGLNGRPVHFVVTDNQSNPSTTVQIYNRLMAQKVNVILGPSFVQDCAAAMALIPNGPVMYCYSPGVHPPAGSYAFSSSLSTTDLATELINYFHSKGLNKIALLTSTDASGQDAETNITAAVNKMKSSGVQLVANEHFNTTDVSVTAQISRIQAAQPQALVAWSTGTAIATVFKAIQQSGLNIPVATTNGNMTLAQMKQYASFLPKTLLFPTTQWVSYDQLPAGPVKDAQTKFFQAMKAAGFQVDLGATLAWDPTMLVLDALKQDGLNASATQIRDYINGQTNWAGVDGIHNFKAVPQRGLGLSQAVVAQWDASKNTWVAVSQPGH